MVFNNCNWRVDKSNRTCLYFCKFNNFMFPSKHGWKFYSSLKLTDFQQGPSLFKKPFTLSTHSQTDELVQQSEQFSIGSQWWRSRDPPWETEKALCCLSARSTHQQGLRRDKKKQIAPYLMHARNSPFGSLMVYEKRDHTIYLPNWDTFEIKRRLY